MVEAIHLPFVAEAVKSFRLPPTAFLPAAEALPPFDGRACDGLGPMASRVRAVKRRLEKQSRSGSSNGDVGEGVRGGRRCERRMGRMPLPRRLPPLYIPNGSETAAVDLPRVKADHFGFPLNVVKCHAGIEEPLLRAAGLD